MDQNVKLKKSVKISLISVRSCSSYNAGSGSGLVFFHFCKDYVRLTLPSHTQTALSCCS